MASPVSGLTARRGLAALLIGGALALAGCGRNNGVVAPAAEAAEPPVAREPAGPAQPNPIDASLAAAAQRCADEPLPAGRGVTYICDCGAGAAPGCVPGADGNDGRSPQRPWRSYERAHGAFERLHPGDTLAFCRGGAFQGSAGQWVNRDCHAGRPCTVRDYTPSWGKSAALAPPKLTGASFSFANGGRAEHEEGYRFWNLDLAGDGQGDGFLVYNDVSDVDLCNLTIDGYAIGVNVEGANAPAPGSSGKNARITLRGSRVLNNKGMGWLGACSGCVVADNFFDHNGEANILDHNVYLGGPRDSAGQLYPAVGMKVTGNKLRRSSRGKGDVCKGVPLVVHGKEQGLLIEGNDIAEELGAAGDGCWGLAVTAAYPDGEAFHDVTIRGNRIVNPGNTAIAVTSCAHCTVENNLVIQRQQAYGSAGIVAGERGHQRQEVDLPLDAVTIRSNTLLLEADSPLESVGIALGAEGSGHVVSGNAIVGSGKNWSCFAFELKPPALQSDYNLCWNRHSPDAWSRGVGSLAAATAAGIDAHSIARDPKLPAARANLFDFAPSKGSPLIGAGDPRGAPATDIMGRKREIPPDIGAYQHTSK